MGSEKKFIGDKYFIEFEIICLWNAGAVFIHSVRLIITY